MRFSEFIASRFRKPSGVSGRIVTFIMNKMNRKLYSFVEDMLDVKPEDCLLDVGFGNGNIIRRLSSRWTHNMIYGIDISEDMVEVAEKKNKNAVLKGNVILKAGNIMDLPYGDSMFDKIYTINTLYFWEMPDVGFKEINRVLRPGGIFLLVEYEKDWLDKIPYTRYGFRKYELSDIVCMIERAGLVTDNVVSIEKHKSYGIFISRRTNVLLS